MKFEVETGFLAPIEIGEFEHVEIVLTSGLMVTVFDDKIFIRTPDQVRDREDGTLIWPVPGEVVLG